MSVIKLLLLPWTEATRARPVLSSVDLLLGDIVTKELHPIDFLLCNNLSPFSFR